MSMMKAHLLKKVAVMMVMAAVPLLILAAGIPGQSEYEKGVCYFQGYGIGQDFSKAVKMWKKAAKKGHVKAEFSLGYCYANGVWVEKDIAEAMAWYHEAAEQGDVDALYNLGLLYVTEVDDMAKFEIAAELFKKAAEQGHVRAMNNLAFCLCRFGPDRQDGYPEVMMWLKRAADQGHWKAKEAFEEYAEEREALERAAQVRRWKRMRFR